MPSVSEQIRALELERVRLERQLSDDVHWRELLEVQAGSTAGTANDELRLKRLLAGNPYYSARLKIVEAITILRRLGEPSSAVDPSHANGHYGEDAPNGSAGDSAEADGSGPGYSRSAIALAMPLGVPLFQRDEDDKPAASELRSETKAVPDEAAPPTTVSTSQATTFAAAAADTSAVVAASIPSSTLIAFQQIKGITPELARSLFTLGVRSVDEIAAWNASDVKRFGTALGVDRRINAEGWIEQAAQLVLRRAAATSPAQARAGDVAEAANSQWHVGQETVTPASATVIAAAATEVQAAAADEAEAIAASTHLPERAPSAAAVASRDSPSTAEPPAPNSNLSPKDWLAERRRARAAESSSSEGIAASTSVPETPPPIPPCPPNSPAAGGMVPAHDIDERAASAPVPGDTVRSEAEVRIVTADERSTTSADSLRRRLMGARGIRREQAAPAYTGAEVEEASVEIRSTSYATSETDTPTPAITGKPGSAVTTAREAARTGLSRLIKTFGRGS